MGADIYYLPRPERDCGLGRGRNTKIAKKLMTNEYVISS